MHLTGDLVVYADGLETGLQACTHSCQPQLFLLTQAHVHSGSAQISLCYNDPGMRAQLLSPKCTVAKVMVRWVDRVVSCNGNVE